MYSCRYLSRTNRIAMTVTTQMHNTRGLIKKAPDAIPRQHEPNPVSNSDPNFNTNSRPDPKTKLSTFFNACKKTFQTKNKKQKTNYS